MAEMRLGRLLLRWCDACNVPVLSENCKICKNRTRAVTYTPPGDIRPAFPYDIEELESLITGHFGFCPSLKNKAIIVNPSPGLDRNDEFIVDGYVFAMIVYDNDEEKTKVLLSLFGANYILSYLESREELDKKLLRWVKLMNHAVPFIEGGASVLAPGVDSACEKITAGEEVIVIAEEPESPCGYRTIYLGKAMFSGPDINSIEKGMCVKKRAAVKNKEIPVRNNVMAGIPEMIAANRDVLSEYVERAKGFILSVIEKNDLPAAVSFSGGKDSLAVFLLTVDAGLDLPVIFTDTGIEFPETLEYVERFVKKRNLKMFKGDAKDGFFKALEYFGPPGRDYRWCCKISKLGPIAETIKKNFPDGVLTFIGQRRYESLQRSKKTSVWRNPWVPNQLSASPIQQWTALHIWFYILDSGEEINPLYFHGLDRIGCFPCPSASMAYFRWLMEERPELYSKWENGLDKFGRELPIEWKSKGLWRWRDRPDFYKGENYPAPVCKERLSWKFHSPDQVVFNRKIDITGVNDILYILGKTELFEDKLILNDEIVITSDGAFFREKMPEKPDRRIIEERKKQLNVLSGLVVRAEECMKCGVCISACMACALDFSDGRLEISKDKCVRCGVCLMVCPLTHYKEGAI